ncbi:MAG: MotA/TolQ/ExbB proton channel family protein [Rhodocyclaceae bacterium]|nr:MotA/TolQ/ExbB proton channel family protein [Rhodocyclaceae bacterium]
MPFEHTGFAQLWAEADAISRGVAVLLLVMSITSWYLIAGRLIRGISRRRDRQAVERFWHENSLDAALARLGAGAADSSFNQLALGAARAAAHYDQHRADTLASHMERGEFLTRAMRQSIALSTARIESGLTVLASIGSTAPFIGLFGTVWGIYHALIRISATGSATLDKVAGPVGEALIMTAAGLFVAIPAVLAYNASVRANRLELAALDAFAHDLHAYLTTGARVESLAPLKKASGGN